jgi:hypothetical protein
MVDEFEATLHFTTDAVSFAKMECPVQIEDQRRGAATPEPTYTAIGFCCVPPTRSS